MHSILAVTLGLISGAAMSVAVSSVWLVLMIPARLIDRFRLRSSRSLTLALFLGLNLAALIMTGECTLSLPPLFGSIALMGGGIFVGMLASALGEILEVVPVLMRRFRLGNVSAGARWMLLLGKALGAIIATLVFTL